MDAICIYALDFQSQNMNQRGEFAYSGLSRVSRKLCYTYKLFKGWSKSNATGQCSLWAYWNYVPNDSLLDTAIINTVFVSIRTRYSSILLRYQCGWIRYLVFIKQFLYDIRFCIENMNNISTRIQFCSGSSFIIIIFSIKTQRQQRMQKNVI